MKDVLVVIDMQNDFCGGALANPAAQAIIPAINEKVKEYKAAGKKIIFTKDTHSDRIYQKSLEGQNIPPHCFYGTEGWRIVDGIEVPNDATIISKPTFGSFEIVNHIGLKDSVEFVGTCTDICVISNALILRAQRPNNDIMVDSKCCAGLTPEKHEAALEIMRSNLIEVI